MNARLIFLVLALSLCAGGAYAQAAPDACAPALRSFAGANESAGYVTVMGVEDGNGTGASDAAYLMLRDGQPFAMFYPNCSVMTSETDLRENLVRYYGQQELARKAKEAAGRMHGEVVALAEVRENGQESECRRLTGMDLHPCDSFASCQYACYSVTSYCYPIALGAGREFVDELWKYANASRRLDAAVGNETIEYGRLEASFSSEAFARYRVLEREVNKAASRMLDSALINWICPQPDFDMASLTEAERDMTDAEYALAPYARTERLAERMALRPVEGTDGAPGANLPSLVAGAMLSAAPGANDSASGAEQASDAGGPCSATIMHQILSGADASSAKVTISTNNCTLGAFEFSDTIPPIFSPDMMEIKWSINPSSIGVGTVVWDFAGLEKDETITMTYTVPRWIGFSKVDGFNGTGITLLGSGEKDGKNAQSNETGTGAGANADAARADANAGNSGAASDAVPARANRTRVMEWEKRTEWTPNGSGSREEPASLPETAQAARIPASADPDAGRAGLAGDMPLRAIGFALVVIVVAAAFLARPKGGKTPRKP
ncbi:MAG: hypothetical protein V1728_06260 [Candidatus Micrarchaeota archaeon]